MAEMSKQDRMNLQRIENQNEVRVTVIYECGSCGHTARITKRCDENGLIMIGTAYCGHCAKNQNLRVISSRVSQVDVKTHKEWQELDASVTESVEDEKSETTSRTESPEVPEKAKGKTKEQGSVD